MQRSEGAKKNEQIKNGPGLYFGAGCIGTTLLIVLFVLVCGFLFFRLADNFTKTPNDFCTEDDNLYQTLVSNGDQWADEFVATDRFYMDVVTSEGKHFHLLRDERRSGFFVAVVWVPRSRWGKAGYFYSRSGELPDAALGDEFTHLNGNIYCYVIAYP